MYTRKHYLYLTVPLPSAVQGEGNHCFSWLGAHLPSLITSILLQDKQVFPGSMEPSPVYWYHNPLNSVLVIASSTFPSCLPREARPHLQGKLQQLSQSPLVSWHAAITCMLFTTTQEDTQSSKFFLNCISSLFLGTRGR